MANTISNSKISHAISSQVPFFVRNDHENFVRFIEAYYEYLEQDTKLVNRAKSLPTFQNIDLTIDEFADKLYENFLKFIPEDEAARVAASTALARFRKRRGSRRQTPHKEATAEFRHLIGRGFPAGLVRDLVRDIQELSL